MTPLLCFSVLWFLIGALTPSFNQAGISMLLRKDKHMFYLSALHYLSPVFVEEK